MFFIIFFFKELPEIELRANTCIVSVADTLAGIVGPTKFYKFDKLHFVLFEKVFVDQKDKSL